MGNLQHSLAGAMARCMVAMLLSVLLALGAAELVEEGDLAVSGGATPTMRWEPAPAGLLKHEHEGEKCWKPCNKRNGPCSWCGKGFCCRKGKVQDGCDGKIG